MSKGAKKRVKPQKTDIVHLQATVLAVLSISVVLVAGISLILEFPFVKREYNFQFTLLQLIQRGYKLLFEDTPTKDVIELAGRDLSRVGVSREMLEEAGVVDISQDLQLMQILTQVATKPVAIYLWNAQYYNGIRGSFPYQLLKILAEPQASCHETMGNSPKLPGYFWLFAVKQRYLIIDTMTRLREGGILRFIFNLVKILKNHVLRKAREQGVDKVGNLGSGISEIMQLYVVVVCPAILVFLVEAKTGLCYCCRAITLIILLPADKIGLFIRADK